jgi:hypothetical protein
MSFFQLFHDDDDVDGKLAAKLSCGKSFSHLVVVLLVVPPEDDEAGHVGAVRLALVGREGLHPHMLVFPLGARGPAPA